MNSIHDMGGMHGFGPIVVEDNEPVFHEDWEGRVYALALTWYPWARYKEWGSFRHTPVSYTHLTLPTILLV